MEVRRGSITLSLHEGSRDTDRGIEEGQGGTKKSDGRPVVVARGGMRFPREQRSL